MSDSKPYNNERDQTPLSARIFVESSAAIISALSVAPAISIIDKAIVSNASGREALLPCIMNGIKSLFINPIYFFKQPSFLFIWGVYSGTYIVGNSIEAICERNDRSSFYPKFIGSSFANVSLSVLKDKAFAKMFGTGDVSKPMPLSSMALFATRDSMTILASFTLPPLIAKELHSMSANSMSFGLCDNLAQLFTPVSMQILSTPLHLLGLDQFNRQDIKFSQRIKFIKQEYLKTTIARMSRIFPAFGVGGVINKKVRKMGKSYLQSVYEKY